jgi:putative peptidoglycan lipid II flippase
LLESPDVSPVERTPSPPTLSDNGGILRAAAILAIGNVVSRVLGLVREIIKSDLFGASNLLGAYTVAALVPMTLFNLITGGEMVSSSLVPVFSDYAAKDKRAELWKVVSSFLTLSTALVSLIIVLVEIFTPQVAWLSGARNYQDPTLVPITIQLMRLATPAVLFLSIASILTGLLFALKRFTLPAFTGAVFNGTIVVVTLLRPDRIQSLVWGILIGSFLQIIIQLPALRDGKIRLSYDWQHPALRRILILYAPIAAGLIINQIAIWISYNLAITTGDNSVTYMTYATTLYQFPLGLVVTALSLAILPTLSGLATNYRDALEQHAPDAGERLNEYKETLAAGLRMIINLILPAAAGLFVLAGPIIVLLLEHGRFTSGDTEITVRVLRLYIIGLPFAAVDQMLVFASYARKDTWRPALAGVISIVIYTIIAMVLLDPLGLLSLMVADAVKHIVHTTIMLWFLRRHVGGLAAFGMRGTLLKSLAAAGLSAVFAFSAAFLLQEIFQLTGFIEKLTIVGVAGLAGFVGFILAVYLFDLKDVKALTTLVIKRLGLRKQHQD